MRTQAMRWITPRTPGDLLVYLFENFDPKARTIRLPAGDGLLVGATRLERARRA